jgi:hypothetical protein
VSVCEGFNSPLGVEIDEEALRRRNPYAYAFKESKRRKLELKEGPVASKK